MSWWKKVISGMLVLMLLLLITLLVLLTTTPGLHLLLNSASRVLPGLSIQQVTGGWQDLTLRGVQYQLAGIEVASDRLHLSLKPSCLWNSQLCINDISLNNVKVSIDSSKLAPSSPEADKAAEPLTEITSPVPVFLQHIGVEDLDLSVDGTQVALGSFASGLSWQGRKLVLTPTLIKNLSVILPDNEANHHQVAEKIVAPITRQKSSTSQSKITQQQWQETEPLADKLQQLSAKPLFDLPQYRLPLDIIVQGIEGENLNVRGATELTINRLKIQAEAIDSHVQLHTFRIRAREGILDASGSAQLEHHWPVMLKVNSTINQKPLQGEKLKLTLSGHVTKQLSVALNLSGPLRADLQIMAQPAVAGLPFSLQLSSAAVAYPAGNAAEYKLENFNLKAGGKATDYRIKLHGQVKGKAIPPAEINLDAKGNTRQFAVDSLQLAALKGKMTLQAVLDWSKAISWRSELTLDNINTATQYPDWPARLAGKISSRGSVYGNSWQMAIPEINLWGNIKSNPLKVTGKVQGNSYNQWSIPAIQVVLGSNHLDIKGGLGDKLDLLTEIYAPSLNGILPGLHGRIMGTIKALGSLSHPELNADLMAQDLGFQEMKLQSLKLKANVLSAQQIKGKFDLRLQGLHQPGVNIPLITMNASGDEQSHQLHLLIDGKPVAGQLALQGHFDRQQQRWQGSINNTRFDTPVGEWKLSRKMDLTFQTSQQAVTLSPHCWRNPDAEICIPDTIHLGADGHASLFIKRFDLAMLKPLLPAETQLKGVLKGAVKGSWAAGKNPNVEANLSGDGVAVNQQLQGKDLPVIFSKLNVKAGLANGRAQLQWLVALLNNGQLTGNIAINDLQARRSLSGNVNIQQLSFDLLQPILANGETIAGMLNANLKLGGDLKKPQVYGSTGLHDLKISTSAMPVQLTSAKIDLSFNGMSSTLNGLLTTTQGKLQLEGNANWQQPANWQAFIAARGDKIRVTVPPMVRLDVSPDLTFEATPTAFNLNGRVTIPWARIQVLDVPESAVGVSSDEVMLNNQLKPIQQKGDAIAINSNLIIHIGDDVRLSAFGLNARLGGELKVVQGASGLGLNGQINIPSGRFHAYGQDLLVRKGQLQFSGPAANPYVNIEAIRNPNATQDDVTAGIRVTGLAEEPKIEIFSDPAKSQQEALSYLLRGQGLGSDGDGNALTSALVGLGVAQSGPLLGKIGETFGVSELALDTTGAGDSQQVQVSGYVLPGLQVKYGVGIFDSLATLTLRYRLMPKLYLEAVSGVDQALDLLYQFEFN